MSAPLAICWFRRDLRLNDHAALYHALRSGLPVLPVFIFDRNILDKLEDKRDRRVSFIHQAIHRLQAELEALGSTLKVYYDTADAAWDQLLTDFQVGQVFTNHDYEPYARQRDEALAQKLKKLGIEFNSYKDQVIFEKEEVTKADGGPYTVFTPYSRTWKKSCTALQVKAYPCNTYFNRLYQHAPLPIPALVDIGFEATAEGFPTMNVDEELLRRYSEQRDYPGLEATSRLGVHLRFGTISIRQLTRQALALNQTFLNELIWRDFYQMILWHFPQLGEGRAFKPAYEHIPWRNQEEEFKRWCNGTTGYPIVDAGMRELNATGFMHNRVRMIVASFLSKHLLIDWRWGEAYFAGKLLDFDLAANNGGWQWAAGCGCDAAPYFRIFNPYLQTKKFDPDLTYIRKWIPELDSQDYPLPMVDHEVARKRCLAVYAAALRS